MKVTVGNKTIVSTDFSNAETAWLIEDAILVLEYFKNKKEIVLGGDILTGELEYNYDSWYYNIESSQNTTFNVEYSIKVAFEYISSYIRKNGNSFYVIFVTQNKTVNGSVP